MDSQRQAEVSHTVAHYLLVIHKLIGEKGYARVTDISKNLGVSKGSASTTLSSLKTRGLIEEADESKFLKLSQAGHAEVHRILSNRKLFYFFFNEILKVDKNTATDCACSIEHLISTGVSQKLFEFMKTLSQPGADSNKQSLINRLREHNSRLDWDAYSSLEQFVKMQPSDFENIEKTN